MPCMRFRRRCIAMNEAGTELTSRSHLVPCALSQQNVPCVHEQACPAIIACRVCVLGCSRQACCVGSDSLGSQDPADRFGTRITTRLSWSKLRGSALHAIAGERFCSVAVLSPCAHCCRSNGLRLLSKNSLLHTSSMGIMRPPWQVVGPQRSC